MLSGSPDYSFLLHNLHEAILEHLDLGWQGPLDFQSLVPVPAEEFAVHTPHFTCKLFDLSGSRSEEIAGNAVIRILCDMFGALGQADYKERITRAFETLNELAQAPGFARYFEIFFRYVLGVYSIPKEDLMDLAIRTIKPDIKEAIMTTYEQLKLEGKVEGRQEAGSRLLARQLSKRFKGDMDQLTLMVAKLTFQQQEELSEKILEAQSLEEIKDWLASIHQN